MSDVALGSPVNRIIEIAGPDRVRMSDLVTQYLKATNDPRKLIADPHALYFGIELDDSTLVPGDNPRIGAVRFDDWPQAFGAQELGTRQCHQGHAHWLAPPLTRNRRVR
jgi:uncharacterized protein YbjT (DUF2867 family)